MLRYGLLIRADIKGLQAARVRSVVGSTIQCLGAAQHVPTT